MRLFLLRFEADLSVGWIRGSCELTYSLKYNLELRIVFYLPLLLGRGIKGCPVLDTGGEGPAEFPGPGIRMAVHFALEYAAKIYLPP